MERQKDFKGLFAGFLHLREERVRKRAFLDIMYIIMARTLDLLFNLH